MDKIVKKLCKIGNPKNLVQENCEEMRIKPRATKVVVGLFIGLCVSLALLVSHVVPDPYMDEIFHVPQAQRYCKGDMTWDPMITTLPGV